MTFAVISGLLLWVAAKFIGPVPPPVKHVEPSNRARNPIAEHADDAEKAR
jgi:hypothetical protein